MYAVIKTGGKQYRVQPGDLLVVEKLDGEPGAEIRFGEVLMLGDGEAVTVGAPLVDGAAVVGTLIETRKGDKVKIFKKKRRQGYRRTRGHRQPESVIRVTSLSGAGKDAKWDGTVDLTPLVELRARARGETTITAVPADALTPVGVHVETITDGEGHVQVVEHADAVATEESAPKKTRAKKAKTDDAAPEAGEA